jgi:hypothetical protein
LLIVHECRALNVKKTAIKWYDAMLIAKELIILGLLPNERDGFKAKKQEIFIKCD